MSELGGSGEIDKGCFSIYLMTDKQNIEIEVSNLSPEDVPNKKQFKRSTTSKQSIQIVNP